MAMMDEIPADLLTVLLPVCIGVVFVIVTVAIVFWLGSNRQRSFEEAKAQASRQAAEVLKEKEHQNSPRAAKKGRRPQRRPKRADQGEDSQEDTPLVRDEGQPRKSILKPVASIAPPKEATPERSPKAKVGFNLSTPPKEDSKSPRTSPPTPHPSKQTAAPLFEAQRTVQPLFEEPEEEETSSAASGTLVAVKPKKPHPQTAVPSGGKPSSKKPRVKSKQQQQSLDDVEALPASRISDIVVSSSLSDEDIQQLMDVLLEKMNTNAEWQAASMRPENVKTLKKQNQDLQNKFEETQRTVVAHSNKIKELRAEIQNEKMRHQSTENGLQNKITSQSNELVIARTKVSGLEEELKQMKAESGTQAVDKLQQENTLLQTNLASMKTMADSQKLSLEAQAKQIQELQDTNASLKSDIQRSKSSRSNEPKLQERVTELEGMLDSVEHEKKQLSVTLDDVCRENTKLKVEVQSITPVREERDALKQQAASLEADNANLRRELDVAQQSSASSLQANSKAVQAELERKSAEDVEKACGELSAQHKKEVEQLQATIARLEGSQGNKDREADDLKAQVDKCSSLEGQLMALNQQLQQEMGSKKELESELESLRSSAANRDAGNGPVDVTDGSGGEELAKAIGERDDLKDQVKQLENKLEELKIKNNSLRDNCWKAKDEAANLEKVCEGKVKEAHIAAGERVKAVKAEVQTKAKEDQQTFLKQLFPSVAVEAQDHSVWLDEFESKVEDLLKGYTDEISSLQCTVEELREREQSTSHEDAEQIRKTLETTRSILEKLQGEVAKQQKAVMDKDVMLEREKSSNRNLQEQLKKEKETSASLQEQLETAQKGEAESADKDRDLESRLADTEGRLKEAEHERDNYKNDVGDLRSSLSQQTEAKDRLQQQAEQSEKQLQQVGEEVQQRQAKCLELEEKVDSLTKKLADSERMVELMKSSNRELNATINSLSPKHKSSKAESEV